MVEVVESEVTDAEREGTSLGCDRCVSGATSSMFLQSWRRMALRPRSVSVSLSALICEMIVLAIVAMLNMKSLFMSR